MNIYIYEFKKYLKSIIVWSISIATLIHMFMSFYPTFGEDAQLMDKIMSNYPKELLNAFGMNGNLQLSTVPGYLVFVYVFVQLLLAMQASNYGFGFLSVEERELTADFLLSKPVSRNVILATKFLSAFTALTMVNFITWISVFSAVWIFSNGKPYESSAIVLLLISNFAFQLIFMSIGMIISVALKKIRSVLSFSMAISFGLYMVNAVAGTIDSKLLGYVSPFYHFEPGYILEHNSLNWSAAIISLIATVLAMVGTYILYNRRDIHSL